jgi:hypothetical protein
MKTSLPELPIEMPLLGFPNEKIYGTGLYCCEPEVFTFFVEVARSDPLQYSLTTIQRDGKCPASWPTFFHSDLLIIVARIHETINGELTNGNLRTHARTKKEVG